MTAAVPSARDVIADLYRYGAWANARLLERAEKLSDADLTRSFSRGALPIHETFTHLYSSDRRWFARWREVPLPPQMKPADLPTIAALRAAWADLGEARDAYIAGLDDAALAATIRWQDGDEVRALSRWQGLVQAANHGMQHRSEIAAMLTDCGHSPGDLDFGVWCRVGAR